MEQTQKFPTEVVELPSKGILYPKDSPLSSGTIEMKYMTAKEEDILTNQNYIEKGIVVDKLLQALIVDKTIDYSQLFSGDINALLVAARILGYGKDYDFTYRGSLQVVDLTKVNNKTLHKDIEEATDNSFNYTTPTGNRALTFKFLTHGDEQKVKQEVNGLKKINKESSAELSTRLKHQLISVDGSSERADVRSFVDNEFLARDSRAFRNYLNDVEPDVDLTFFPEGGPEGGVRIPLGISFLWPDADL